MEDLIQSIVVISAIFILVAVFVIAYVIYFNRRKSRLIQENIDMKEKFLQSRIEVQEHTFQQIGKELHDNVGQLLSTSRMLLGLTERKMTDVPDTLITANATLGKAIDELRSLSKCLDKEWLEQFSFVENIKTEVARINIGQTVHTSFSFSDHIPLSPDEQIVLFRIVQEAVQNAIKHANPQNIVIDAAIHDSTFRVSVKDDGTGSDSLKPGKGQGLVNMNHRAALLGGTISWDSAPDRGTLVNISIPVNKNIYENNDWHSG